MIGCIEKQGEYLCDGNDIGDYYSKEDCALRCYNTTGCMAWTFRISNNHCYLTTSALCTRANENYIWGSRECEKHVPGSFMLASFLHLKASFSYLQSLVTMFPGPFLRKTELFLLQMWKKMESDTFSKNSHKFSF